MTTTAAYYLTIILAIGSPPVEVSTGPFTKKWCDQLIQIADDQFKRVYLDGQPVEFDIVCKPIDKGPT